MGADSSRANYFHLGRDRPIRDFRPRKDERLPIGDQPSSARSSLRRRLQRGSGRASCPSLRHEVKGNLERQRVLLSSVPENRHLDIPFEVGVVVPIRVLLHRMADDESMRRAFRDVFEASVSVLLHLVEQLLLVYGIRCDDSGHKVSGIIVTKSRKRN